MAGVSRQRKWQLKRNAVGLCELCGKRPVLRGGRCETHYQDMLRGKRDRRAAKAVKVTE